MKIQAIRQFNSFKANYNKNNSQNPNSQSEQEDIQELQLPLTTDLASFAIAYLTGKIKLPKGEIVISFVKNNSSAKQTNVHVHTNNPVQNKAPVDRPKPVELSATGKSLTDIAERIKKQAQMPYTAENKQAIKDEQEAIKQELQKVKQTLIDDIEAMQETIKGLKRTINDKYQEVMALKEQGDEIAPDGTVLRKVIKGDYGQVKSIEEYTPDGKLYRLISFPQQNGPIIEEGIEILPDGTKKIAKYFDFTFNRNDYSEDVVIQPDGIWREERGFHDGFEYYEKLEKGPKQNKSSAYFIGLSDSCKCAKCFRVFDDQNERTFAYSMGLSKDIKGTKCAEQYNIHYSKDYDMYKEVECCLDYSYTDNMAQRILKAGKAFYFEDRGPCNKYIEGLYKTDNGVETQDKKYINVFQWKEDYYS